MKKSKPVLLANVLTVLAFFLHGIGGDIEVQMIKPDGNKMDYLLQIWTMVRCGWHWISFDFLMASIGLYLINFSNYFVSKKEILKLFSFYFLGYAIVWLLTIIVSGSLGDYILKLGQWLLLLMISGLLWIGSRSDIFEENKTLII